MRTLTPAIIAAKNADTMQPVVLMKWELPAPVGTKWYSTEDFGDADASAWNHAQARVIEWGALRMDHAADKRVNVVSDTSLTLRDDDTAIWADLQDGEPQRSIATADEKAIPKDDRSGQDGSDAAAIGRHIQQVLSRLESPA